MIDSHYICGLCNYSAGEETPNSGKGRIIVHGTTNLLTTLERGCYYMRERGVDFLLRKIGLRGRKGPGEFGGLAGGIALLWLEHRG